MNYSLAYWRSNLLYTDWYYRLKKDLLIFNTTNTNDFEKQKIYRLVNQMLKKKQIPLASQGPDMDVQRAKIDTIVLHHTGGIYLDFHMLSAIGLLRLYGPLYNKKKIHTIPIWSGHFQKENQVFYGYHWLVLRNGKSIRLLKDSSVGWHSGNWAINKRSIAIALSGNFEKEVPTKRQIDTLIRILKENYSFIDLKNVVGHKAFTRSVCPGINFLKIWEKEVAKNSIV